MDKEVNQHCCCFFFICSSTVRGSKSIGTPDNVMICFQRFFHPCSDSHQSLPRYVRTGARSRVDGQILQLYCNDAQLSAPCIVHCGCSYSCYQRWDFWRVLNNFCFYLLIKLIWRASLVLEQTQGWKPLHMKITRLEVALRLQLCLL